MVSLPRELFEKILEYMPIPCIDLIIENEYAKLLFCRRNIPPYKNKWAFPGGRILKGETIRESIERITEKEVGISVSKSVKEYLVGVYSTSFRSEHNRQDISICYYLRIPSITFQSLVINREHYSGCRFDNKPPNSLCTLNKREYRDFISKFK